MVQECFRVVRLVKNIYAALDTAGSGIGLIEQLPISCNSLYPHIRVLPSEVPGSGPGSISQILDLEHYIHIADSIGAHILIQEQAVLHLSALHWKNHSLLCGYRNASA